MTATFESIEGWIRQGKLRLAATQLREGAPEIFELKLTALHDPTRLQFAQLCRRAGLAMLGLRALRPLVRPGARRRGSVSSASPAIVMEYAALLLRLGATTEASSWLAQVRSEDVADKSLFEAFACFRRWDYAASLAPLRAYCLDPRLSPYARLVGQVNLAAALVIVRDDTAAEKLLQELLLATASGGHQLLHGNSLETLVQLRVLRGRNQEALDLLREIEAKGFLKPGAESILFRKWEAIARRSAAPEDVAARRQLRAISQEAQSIGSWEVVRDCDYHEARILSDKARMERLYFGTSYPAYRQRVLDLGFIPSRTTYLWSIQSGPTPHRLDTRAGSLDSTPCMELRPGSLGLRLLQTIASDFYRPWRVAELHSALYPGEHFDWESSPLRVHQLLHRVRGVLAQNKSPIRIEETRESYSLGSLTSAQVQVVTTQLASGSEGRVTALCEQLAQAFGANQPFSVSDAESLLRISGRTLRRQLAVACESGKITKSGTTRAARYRLI